MKATYGRFEERYELPVWDDGFGDVYVYFETLGPMGVVRSDSWESAYEAVVDEIMSDADPEDAVFDADGNLPDGILMRSNGLPSNPRLKSYFAAEDLNGSYLVPLGDRMAVEYGVQVEFEEDEL